MMTRRKLLQTAGVPIAGAMALPALSEAIQELEHGVSAA